ncbi:MAG: penicillin-binding protein 2 [Gammaproteobacteria bacterium]|nr:penicillin-binding protein 2 [Gammaproteobacteria bacterium]
MNTTPELKRFFKRSIVCATIILSLFFLLFLRLIFLQLFEHHFYATLSDRNVISIIPVKPDRGLIYDRNGVLLAKNIPVYSLMVTPARVKDLPRTISALENLLKLSPDEVKNFFHIVKQYYPYQSVPLKQSLDEAQVASFYVNQYRFPGVEVQTNMIRNYPLSNSMSDVVGYVGRINANELAQVNPSNYTASDEIGKAGVEAEDEVLLHGTMGSEEAEIDANGKVVRVMKTTAPVPGDNIYLTIDSKLQAYAAQLLGSNAGAVVAIQPATGQVLALVTKPNYDPNLFVQGMTNAQYHEITTAPDHPLFNRATRATYAPGSTVKPFIAFGALNDGVITTQDYIFDPGFFRLPNTTHIFHNWVKKGFGWVNVTKAIRVSCDTFFYQLATVLGIDRLDQALTQFGFGELTGINLPSERPGNVPSPAWKQKHIGQSWYAGDTVVAGIGQGYMTATPLQLAAATAIMAERGLRFQPTVLLKLQQPDGVKTEMQPIAGNPIVAKDPKTWETVIAAMQEVTSNAHGGTAYGTFLNAPYSSAGKTGTAQVYDNSKDNQDDPNAPQKDVPKRLQNNHLFIVFAPVDNPQIAVAVVVEHIHGMSQAAVLIARQLIDFYLKEQAAQNPAITNSNVTTLPQAILPAPQGNAAPQPTTDKHNLPAPAGASLISDRSMQSVTSKQPDKNNNSQAPNLPKPSGSDDIKNALKTDLTQESQQKNNGFTVSPNTKQTPDVTTTPPTSEKNKKQTSADLQQQMDAGIDTQMDMQKKKR